MKPRRTFCVRVSSPSSASSSLCRIRKRRICAPAMHLVLGERRGSSRRRSSRSCRRPADGRPAPGSSHRPCCCARPSCRPRSRSMLINTATKSRPSPKATASRMFGIELQLVLDVLRREQRAVLEPADVLGAVDDLQVPVLLSKKPASPVLHLAVRRLRLAWSWRRPCSSSTNMPGDLNSTSPLSAMLISTFGSGGPDGVGIDLAVRLRGDVEARLGLAVELLQVDAERAVEREQLRPDRLAGGVGDAHAARARARSSAARRPGCCRAQ